MDMTDAFIEIIDRKIKF